MELNMKDMTVTALNDYTASASPAPGGGSISAMAGAYGAALVCMVAKLTLDKKGYEDKADLMKELDTEAEALRLDLLTDIQKDSESFNAYMDALKLPKDTEAQKAARGQAMQDALKGACQVPLGVARKCVKVLDMAVQAVEHGNINTASDGKVGVLMGRAAILGAVNNVLINLGGIKDEEFVQKMKEECAGLEAHANQQERYAREVLHLR